MWKFICAKFICAKKLFVRKYTPLLYCVHRFIDELYTIQNNIHVNGIYLVIQNAQDFSAAIIGNIIKSINKPVST